ncbi:Porphobilinogen deaminase [Novipirellula aureliae]|uniref:Hydroxymethylbilane synthase n=2 Tax=Novipirellula aureliae TaxID=2527966 RepID=A0A5C6E7B2_9BACT|nr:Porphobilinogen deaminase [Novipirellula aureliae]
MWQAKHVAMLLEQAGQQTELVPLVSRGDTDMRPIDSTRQVGVFTKRIQQALLDDEADIAVHSMKDLPTEVDPRLHLVAVPQREIVNDCIVSPARWSLDTLPHKARIGTGSRRRAAQMKHHRSDLSIEPIRGNLQTRLAKLENGDYDAIMLAAAGILRLEMESLPRIELPLSEMLPAPGQGALAIEVLAEAEATIAQTRCLNDPRSRAAVTAERTLLANLNGGCLAPIAAYASFQGDSLHLESVVLSADGSVRLADQRSLPLASGEMQAIAIEIANQASEVLASQGAKALIGR